MFISILTISLMILFGSIIISVVMSSLMPSPKEYGTHQIWPLFLFFILVLSIMAGISFAIGLETRADQEAIYRLLDKKSDREAKYFENDRGERFIRVFDTKQGNE